MVGEKSSSSQWWTDRITTPLAMLARIFLIDLVERVLVKLGLYRVAVAYYRYLIRLMPSRRARLLSYLAGVYEEAGRPEEALDCYRASRDLEPERASTYFDIATTCERLRRRNDAISNYQRFIELDQRKGDLEKIARDRLAALAGSRGE